MDSYLSSYVIKRVNEGRCLYHTGELILLVQWMIISYNGVRDCRWEGRGRTAEIF